MKIQSNGFVANSGEGEKKVINSELWHACAGPLVSLPPSGSLVVYFPQGHSEQVAASMHKKIDDIPSYPNLPSKLVCMLHSVTLHADTETDEVYSQMTLQPVNKYDQEALLMSDIGLKSNRQPAEFFCKTLTASDTSTHGGFSVPRRAAEKIFPPLDFTMQPPCQELAAKDLHDQTWTFRHIFRGQPKRHLLTTGWSVFVSSKRLIAGDAVLFIRDEKSRFLLGIRRANNRQQPPISSSVMSSDSMHIGILAAAAHAAANNSSFTIFYNPRTSPSEFVVPLAKYNKAMYAQVSMGMRFRMMFETEESGVRRYVGTVTGTSDLDPVRWKGSQWRNLQVGWDESTAGERPSRVSIWEIEPVVTPFYICPPPFFRPNYPKLPGDDQWIADDYGLKDASSSMIPGMSLDQWMSMQQSHHFSTNPSTYANLLSQDTDNHSKLLSFKSPSLTTHNTLQSSISWPQQPHPQQTLNSRNTSQPQQRQQFPSQQINHQTQQQQLPPVTSGLISDQMGKQYSQLTALYPQFQQQQQQQQQQQILTENQQVSQNEPSPNKTSFPLASMTRDILAQQQVEHNNSMKLQFMQQNLMQRPQVQQTLQQSISEQQLQLQLLQRLQQQQVPQSQQATHVSPPQQKMNGTSCSDSLLMQSPQFPLNDFQTKQKTQVTEGPQSLHPEAKVPICSTTPSKFNSHMSQQNFMRNPQGESTLPHNSAHHTPNLVQENTHIKFESRTRNDILPGSKVEQAKYKGVAVDRLDAETSVAPYCLDAGGLQQNFPLAGSDNGGLAPDALLSRGYDDSGKDVPNLRTNCSGASRDIDTDTFSGVNCQSFGMPAMNFKSGGSNDAVMNEVTNDGLWPNHTQRMRTYTKVQKRGSVGRTIDVTRYTGYEELRRDLARMFGIEGVLEDPRKNEWKLVYVDHENDILLLGDDPWDEFVSCVQSIKILSSSEVQQMSLDGDLPQLPVANPACSGTDSGNAWRGNYDVNSATSYNR